MGNSADYIAYLIDTLEPLGFIQSRAMFGGHGLYFDGRMFALVADDTLYLKVDDQNRAAFEAEGLDPFRYPKKDGEQAVMAYYQAPSAALDDTDILLDWARLGIEASMRAPAKKKKRKSP
ncbi:MAG: TfoX/Sxy family protein [Pseudomonadota bacterium]